MKVHKVDPHSPDRDAIREAADAIRRGELVVFPTETVYGLAADALNEAAVKRVFDAKGRAERHPLPVQVAGVEQLGQVASEVPDAAKVLAERFWPGPLTIVLPRNPSVPDIVTGGRDTIGVRVPEHLVALALLREIGGPIIATSANLSGRSAPRSAECAISEVGSKVSVVLDAGESEIGVASTVVDVSVVPPRILRRGAIDAEELRAVLGEVDECDGE
jgi:L-threonylcarbamoyladenylate synthase